MEDFWYRTLGWGLLLLLQGFRFWYVGTRYAHAAAEVRKDARRDFWLELPPALLLGSFAVVLFAVLNAYHAKTEIPITLFLFLTAFAAAFIFALGAAYDARDAGTATGRTWRSYISTAVVLSLAIFFVPKA